MTKLTEQPDSIILIAIILAIAFAVVSVIGSGIQKQMEKTSRVISGEMIR